MYVRSRLNGDDPEEIEQLALLRRSADRLMSVAFRPLSMFELAARNSALVFPEVAA